MAIGHLEGDDARADQTLQLIKEAGRIGIAVPGDLRSEADCQGLVDRTVERFGRIDILVNNAGYQMVTSGIEDITTEQWDRVLKTNLYAAFWMCKKSIPYMPKGSAIINTSSMVANNPVPQLLDYSVTKAGLVNLTRGLSLMLADKGIRVNSVAPGPVWTPLIPASMPEDWLDDFGTDTPMGRAGQPAEVAPAYVFLASKDASFVTGEILGVTGGYAV